MRYSILDIETDGLIENVTKIHCMSVNEIADGVERRFSLTDYQQIKEYIEDAEVIIGHNIILYDIPVLKKMLDVEVKAKLIDSLGLSWYLYPNMIKHGLEEWGEKLGIAKPKIADWNNLAVEDYLHRCETDVEINTRLWNKQWDYLMKIYNDENSVMRIIGYLSFKLDCAREQEQTKWKLDIEKCKENLLILKSEEKIKVDALSNAMPPAIEYKIVSRPKVLVKKDGEISVAGQKWFDLLKDKGLPENHVSAIQTEVGREKGNPGSHQQLKSWLFSVGWEPVTFKYVKKKLLPTDAGYTPMNTETVRKVPQLSTEDGLCQSVIDLMPANPGLEHLDSLYKIQHRIGILEGFLQTVNQDGYVISEIGGFTNTLRMQHKKPICNLPTLFKPYGKLVRECLVAPEGFVLCGSDMSSLEESTKHHYMMFYDPKYVEEMRQPGFDPHIDIAVLAGMVAKSSGDWFKWLKSDKKFFGELVSDEAKNAGEAFEKELKGKISKIRDKAKKSNFASVYGAGPPKIALTAGIPLSEAKLLHTTYWKRNWSVKRIAKNTVWKTVDDQMWLFNPVSRFWYSLRFEKDIFSTLNQGTGVYCFDTWVRKTRGYGIRISMQYHDEIAFGLPDGEQDQVKQFLHSAIEQTNSELQLNVKLGISIDFGASYADIH